MEEPLGYSKSERISSRILAMTKIVLAVNINGDKEVLSIEIGGNESNKY